MKFKSSLILGLVFAFSITSCDFINGLLPSTGESNLEGYVYASKDRDDWGILDAEGNVIVEDEWKTAPSAPKEGMVFVKNKKGEIEFFTVEEKPKQIGDKYKEALPFCEGLAAVVEPNKPIAFIDKSGEVVFELDKGIIEVRSFSEGLAPYKIKENKWGFIDRTGKELIEAEWKFVSNFSEGLASVTTYDEGDNVDHRAFINTKGDVVFDLEDEYDRVGVFSDGKALVLDDDEWGYINMKGEEVIKCKWESATPFRDGYAAVRDDGEWGLIDDSGERILRTKFGQGLADCFYYPRTKDIFFEIDGDEIEAYNFEGDKLFSIDGTEAVPFCADYTAVKDKDEYYFINENGEPVNDEDYDVVNLDGLRVIMPYYLNNRSVTSDFFDVGALVSGMKIKPSFPVGCTLGQIMDSHGISEDDLPTSKYGSTNSFRRSVDLGDNQSTSVKYVFYSDVTTAEKKKITTTNYWGKPVTKIDYTGKYITNKDARLRYVEWTFYPSGKGDGKEKMIAEAVIDELKGAYPGIKLDQEEGSTNREARFASFTDDADRSKINLVLEYRENSKIEFMVRMPEAVDE